MTGVKRYIANDFSDAEKNDSIKLILGRHVFQKPFGI